MRIFINDIPVRIIRPERLEKSQVFEIDINAKKDSIQPEQFVNNVLVRNATFRDVDNIIEILERNPFAKLASLTILINSDEKIKSYIKSKFTLIKAAGGIIRKGKKILMIYRLRKWDLPKGKVESSETFEEAAVREVEEECNIKVKLGERICSSYHTYTLGNKDILKKTVWFSMSIVDDRKMVPATGEGIDEIRWMNHKELLHSLQETYHSLSYVMSKYFKKMGQIE